MKINILSFLSRSRRNQSHDALETAPALAFDELNPLLAKQLSELEVQIGQLAQVQFELAEERSKMRSEMDALKKVLQDSQTGAGPMSTLNNEAP